MFVLSFNVFNFIKKTMLTLQICLTLTLRMILFSVAHLIVYMQHWERFRSLDTKNGKKNAQRCQKWPLRRTKNPNCGSTCQRRKKFRSRQHCPHTKITSPWLHGTPPSYVLQQSSLIYMCTVQRFGCHASFHSAKPIEHCCMVIS